MVALPLSLLGNFTAVPTCTGSTCGTNVLSFWSMTAVFAADETSRPSGVA